MFNRKIESSIFDVVSLYVCMGFVTYVVGAIAYNFGKDKAKEEIRRKHNDSPSYYDFYREES